MLISLGFIIGAVLGSFTKALADRSLTNRTFWGRSYCLHCKHALRWYDLFPILSFVFLRGKCHYCHKSISKEYLLVEIVLGLLIAFLFWQQFDIFNLFFISILSVLFMTDIKKMLIPDRIVLPAIVIALAAKPFAGGILTALGIAGFFYALILVTRGKGMGGGDVKLGAFIGLGLGFPNGILALALSFFLGALVSLALIFLGKKKFGQTIPFGPFLVTGALIALFWGDKIINWYLLGT